jgi:predicted dehydrogenase
MVDLPPDHARYWLMQKEAGGGSLFGVGSHAIDLFLHLGGDIAEVSGAVDRLVTGGDADDVAAMVCRFRSGALGLMSSSYNSPSGTLSVEISGTEARIAFDAIPRDTLFVTRQGRTEEIKVEQTPREDLDLELIRTFTRHVTDGAPFAIPGEEGLKTNAVMDALLEASRTRRWVTVDADPS